MKLLRYYRFESLRRKFSRFVATGCADFFFRTKCSAFALVGAIGCAFGAFAQPFILQGVNPSDFRVTTFASGLNFPMGMVRLDDDSLLIAVSDGGTFNTANGKIVRLTDTNQDGVADGPGEVLYSGLTGGPTTLQTAGSLVLVTSLAKPIAILRSGALPSDSLTLIGRLILNYPTDWTQHRHSTLGVRKTPGFNNRYDIVFQIGAKANFAKTTSTLTLTYENIQGTPGTLVGDSVYMLTIIDDGVSVSASNLTLLATGLRNSTGIAFHPVTGDLYLGDNGIDGLVDVNESHSADELNVIPQAEIGGASEFFGFPTNYTQYRTGTFVGGLGIAPRVAFQPLPDPFTGHESEGVNHIAIAPPGFPNGVNSGIFLGFHGKYSLAGTSNEENPVVYADPETGGYFHFILGQQTGIGHLDGLLASRDSLFVADFVSTGSHSSGGGKGIIYQIKSLVSPTVTLHFDTVPSGLTLKFDGVIRTTPFDFHTVIGFQHSVEAIDQSQGGNDYSFLAWSDEGTQNHVIIVPDQSANFVASYIPTDPPVTLPLTWANPAAITYGTALSGTQLNATAGIPGTFVFAPPSGAVLNAGNGQVLSVTFTPSDLVNFAPTTAAVTIDVLRAPLTIKAQDHRMASGAALPALTAAYTGFVNGDTAASLDTPVSLSTTATTVSPVGTYPITASGTADANYAITHVYGTLTVAATSVVKVNFQPSGAMVPSGYLVDTGALFGDRGNGQSYGWTISNTSSARDRNSTVSPDQRYDTLNQMQPPEGARSWQIAVPNGNYQVEIVAGDPSYFSGEYRINAEGVRILTGTPTTTIRWIAGANTVTVNDGRLNVSNGGGAISNKICFIHIARQPEDGVESVPITWANFASVTYGTALSDAQLNATASIPGTFVFTPPAGTVLNLGNSQVLSVTFTPSDLVNFAPTSATMTIDVLRAPLTITAENQSMVSGAVLPTLTAAYTGFVNGDSAASLDTPVSLSTTATTASPEGTYPITASDAADANYTIAHVNGTLTVTAPSVVKINFQPSGAAVPSGYLADTGALFDHRGNGQSYGWTISNTSSARDRDSSGSPDQRYDTLNQMQPPEGARSWQIAVPNGNYQIEIVAGDPSYFDGDYRINAEGVRILTGTPTTTTRWIAGSKTVTVNDGRLNVSNGGGAISNKICFIHITPVIAQSQFLAAAPKVSVEFEEPVRLELVERDSSGRITLRLEGAADADYAIEASSDFIRWEPVTVVPNLDGTLSFDDPGSLIPLRRIYRVRPSRGSD